MNFKASLNEEDYFLYDIYTTILNSDYAALTKWEQLVSTLKSGEKFLDTEFGPKDANDEVGNKMSLYSKGEAPPGLIKPEQVCWLRPEEIAGNSEWFFIKDEASSNCPSMYLPHSQVRSWGLLAKNLAYNPLIT